MHNFQNFLRHFFPSANIFHSKLQPHADTHALPHNNEPNSSLIQLQCRYAHLFRLCLHNNHALKYLKYILDFLFLLLVIRILHLMRDLALCSGI